MCGVTTRLDLVGLIKFHFFRANAVDDIRVQSIELRSEMLLVSTFFPRIENREDKVCAILALVLYSVDEVVVD